MPPRAQFLARHRAAMHGAAILATIVASLACSQNAALSTATAPATQLSASSPPPSSAPPPQPAQAVLPASRILVGTEYILIENANRLQTLAQLLEPVGLSMAKPLPEHIEWGQMQPSQEAPIDFKRLDNFIREFQAAGFTDFLLALKSHSPWASRTVGKPASNNPAPKPEFMQAYEAWIFSLVERYDADGLNDMPGLLSPVRYYEIGSEFSSYEPEPVEDYLEMLEHAFAAAHRADPEVTIAPAAFLTTLAFASNPAPEEYETAFAGLVDQSHSLADMRKVLDHPDIFDAVNVHALGDPYEIEAIVGWLNYEMGQRGYRKNILISDTTPTPFIAWGPATACDRNPAWMGKVIPPATEADRCRLADYFSKLVAGDEGVLLWTQSFIAQDTVKRVIIAAEQGITLINTAFTEDLFWLKLPVVQAGAGTSAWAGQLDVEQRAFRPAYYALQQLISHMNGYDQVRRIPFDDPGVRVYLVSSPARQVWISWYDSGKLILPDDPIPETSITLQVGSSRVIMERLITQAGQTRPETEEMLVSEGDLDLNLSPMPIFIIRGD